MADQRLQLRGERVEWRVVEGEIVALTTDSDRYLGANRTGALLWAALADGSDRSQLAALLRDAGATPEAAESDVESFLEALRTRGLLAE